MTGILGAIIGSMGGSADELRIDTETFSDTATDPTDASVQIVFETDGDLSVALGGAAAVVQYQYIDPSDNVADYHVRATLVSGTVDTGTTGSWLALSSQRAWFIEQTSFGTKTTVIDFELSDDGGSTVLETGRITLSAVVDF